MNKRLHRRLTKLEEQLRDVRNHAIDSADEKLKRDALCLLSPEELEVLIDYARQLQGAPGTQPNPAQAAALDIYNQRYREFQSGGTIMVNGWPVEVWPDEPGMPASGADGWPVTLLRQVCVFRR